MVHILQDLTILLLVSLPINILFHKIRLPSIVGFLIAGILIGPHGLQMVDAPESVQHQAEIGVILLLFIIGLEFSLAHLLKNLRRVLGTGGLQLILTACAGFFICLGIGLPIPQGLALGLMGALSSTAIVLKMLTDQAELDTLHGRICVGVLLFQDLCVVPLMLIIPLLAHAGEVSSTDFLLALLKSIVAVGALFFASRLLVPKVLGYVARVGNKEHLTLAVILIILGTCWLSEKLGLSLAMGAFLAGMIISESEYHHQIVLDILPMKDYFVSIFFISIGMLLEWGVLVEYLPQLLGWFLAVVVLKAALAFTASLLAGNSTRISFIVGLRLAQVGEFSLILSGLALEQGLLDAVMYQYFLIISILTMLVAPVLIQLSAGLSFRVFSRLGEFEEEVADGPSKKLSGHVIIAGFGLVGQNLSRVLKETQIPFVVVELDGERIKKALAENIEVLYGDCSHREILIRAGIKNARMIVIAIQDYRTSGQVVRLARRLNPELYILVRTQYASQVDELNQAGANQVIPGDFETSIEIFARVLREFNIPNNIIEQQVELIRLEGYSMFRGLSLPMEGLRRFSTYLTASLSKSFQVMADSWVNNRRLEDLQLNARTGATLIAAVRDQKVQPNPAGDFQPREGDILILFGSHAQVDHAMRLLQSGPETSNRET